MFKFLNLLKSYDLLLHSASTTQSNGHSFNLTIIHKCSTPMSKTFKIPLSNHNLLVVYLFLSLVPTKPILHLHLNLLTLCLLALSQAITSTYILLPPYPQPLSKKIQLCLLLPNSLVPCPVMACFYSKHNSGWILSSIFPVPTHLLLSREGENHTTLLTGSTKNHFI